MSDNGITLYKQPESPEEYLEHYGVKGMKWGVRKNKTVLRQICRFVFVKRGALMRSGNRAIVIRLLLLRAVPCRMRRKIKSFASTKHSDSIC